MKKYANLNFKKCFRSLTITILTTLPFYGSAQKYDSSLYAQLSFGLGYINFSTPSNYPKIPDATHINRFVGIQEVRMGGTINRMRFSTAYCNTDDVAVGKEKNQILSFDFECFDVMLGYRWRVNAHLFDEITADLGFMRMISSTVNYQNRSETTLDSMFARGANSVVVSRNMHNYLPIEFSIIKYISDPEVWSLSFKVKAFIPTAKNNEVLGNNEFYTMTIGLSRKIIWTK